MAELTIAALSSDGHLQFGDGYRTKRSEHGQPGFRILRVADVHDRSISLDSPDFVSTEHTQAMGSKLSQPGDILLTTKGTVGRVAVFPDGVEQVVYSPQLCYFRVSPNPVVDAGFLSYWFKSPDFVRQASHRANNTDMAAYINLTDIASLRLSLPTIETQRAIADVLSALDDKIAANDRGVELADALAVARLAQVATGDAVRLDALAEIIMGSSPPGTSYNETGDGVPFYQGVRDFGTRFPSRRVWTNAPVRVAEPADILLSVRAPVGRTNVANERLCIGRGLAAIRSLAGTPNTLIHQLRAADSAWAPYEAEGTVFGAIKRTELAGVSLRSVPGALVHQVEVELGDLESLISALLSESDVLASARDELLPLLMSGKITVREAEKTVEEIV